MRDPVRIIIWTLAVALGGLTALGFGDRLGLGGRAGWLLDLLSHWPKHLFLGSLIVGVVAGLLRYRVAAGVAVAAAAINLTMVLGVGGYALPQAAPANAKLLRVMSANVHRSDAALNRAAELARSYDADIVALYEVPDDMTLADFVDLFPHLPAMSLPSMREVGWEMRQRSFIAARDVGPIAVELFDYSHGVVLRTTYDDVLVTTTHPPSPGDPALRADRNRQLAQAGRIDTARPFVIMGDLNSTPWGRPYGYVPGVRAGDPRFDGTFPAGTGWFGLPIDHIKFGGGLTLTDFRLGELPGSDHRPLLATFALPEE